MADNEQEGAAEAAVPAPKGKLKLIIAVVAVLAIAGGGATWFFFMRGHGEEGHGQAHAEAPPPKPPSYIEVPDMLVNLIGLPGAQWRITHSTIPGMTVDFGLIEYSGVARSKILAGAHDPGSPAFTKVVRDLSAATDQWTKAGGTVVTTGGRAVESVDYADAPPNVRVSSFIVSRHDQILPLSRP